MQHARNSGYNSGERREERGTLRIRGNGDPKRTVEQHQAGTPGFSKSQKRCPYKIFREFDMLNASEEIETIEGDLRGKQMIST
jgi:hypothetical protein